MSERSEQPVPGPRHPAPGPASAASFLFAGGGTGGHVIPALAVARELRRRGHGVFFVGTERGLESKLVPAEGFKLAKIEIGGLNRVGLGQKIATLLQLPLTTLRCGQFVRQASAVFSMGGYVAGPPVIAALAANVPVVVMEPNAVPGFTNRIIGSAVSRALISFPETARFFRDGKTEMTGLPVREEFFQIPAKPRGGIFSLLVTGGSQGSLTLNRASVQSWPLFQQAGARLRILHQAGRAAIDAANQDLQKFGIEGEIVEFIKDMPAAFAAADLIVCRSGAGAVSELAAAGKPSILVPFPFAADDHQTRNAEAMERAGAARLIRDRELNGKALFEAVMELAGEPGALERMGDAARQFAKPGAACRAADILEEVARR